MKQNVMVKRLIALFWRKKMQTSKMLCTRERNLLLVSKDHNRYLKRSKDRESQSDLYSVRNHVMFGIL